MVETDEPLEDVITRFGGNAKPVVVHDELHIVITLAERENNATLRMTRRVVGKVAQKLTQVGRIAADPASRNLRSIHDQLCGGAQVTCLVQDNVVKVDHGSTTIQDVLVGTGQNKQVVDETLSARSDSASVASVSAMTSTESG